MTRYLISFPSETMDLEGVDIADVATDAHNAIAEAKAAGVYVFSAGIDESVAPVLVRADGSVSPDINPGSDIRGGFAIYECATRDEALAWAAKLAKACRAPQEVRAFMDDDES